MSTPTRSRASRVAVSIDPRNQNLETVHQLVALVLKKAGCSGCGRLAFLDIRLVGDPDPDFSGLGVISVEAEQI